MMIKKKKTERPRRVPRTTAGKTAKPALRESGRYLDNLFNHANAPIIVWDPQFKITRFNHAFEKLTGRRAEDVLGKHVRILFPPQQVKTSMAQIRKTQTGEHWESVEIGISNIDESVRTVLWNSATLFKPDGRTPVATIAQGQDITGRKRAEEELSFFAAMYRQMLEGVYLIRAADGIIVSTNPAFDAMFGYKPGELEGKHVSVVNAPDGRSPEQVAREIMAQLNLTGRWQGEVQNRKKDGTLFWCQAVVSTFDHPRFGKVWLSSHRDITGRKRAEERLRQSEKLYRDLIETALVGVYATNIKGDILFVNDAAVQIFGFASADKLKAGGALARYRNPRDREALIETLKITGQVYDYEFEALTESGETRNVILSAVLADGIITGTILNVTERRRADQALRENEERLKLITETVDEVFWMADIQSGNIIYASPAYQSIWGRSLQSLYENPSSFAESIHPDDAARALAGLKLEKEGRQFDQEYRILRPDGVVRWIWDRRFPIREPGGETLRYAGIAQDITERKRATEALQDSELRFRRIFEQSPMGYQSLDAEGVIQDVNPSWLDMLGYQREEVVGHRIDEFFMPDSKTAFAERFPRFRERGATHGSEFQMRRKDGAILNVIVDGVFIRDAQSRPVYTHCIVQDITARKLAESKLLKKNEELAAAKARLEQALGIAERSRLALLGVLEDEQQLRQSLKASEEQYRTMIENSNDMIWTLDAEGRFLFFNKRSEEISGYRFEDWAGKSFAPLIKEEDLPIVAEAFKKTIGGLPQQYEASVRRSDGSYFVLSVNSAPLYSNGIVAGTVSFGRDITERKLAEVALRESEARYRLLFNGVNDSVFLHETRPGTKGDFKIIEVNDRACERLGYTRDEMLCMTIADIDVPEQAQFVPEILRKLYSDGQAMFETEHLSKDHVRIPMEVNIRLVTYKGKEAILSVARDMTERKRAEAALRESEESYRQLFEMESDAMIMTEQDTGRIINANRAALALYGYTSAELLALKNIDLSAEPGQTMQALSAQPSHIAMRLHRKKDGVIFPVEITISYFELRGKPVHLAAIRDITDRQRAEYALKESEERFKNIFEYAADGMLLANMEDKHFVLGNKKICEMLGYTHDELMQKSVADIHPPENLTEIIGIFERQARKEQLLAPNLPVLRKDGIVFYTDVNSFPVTIAGKQHLLGIFRDVTDRQRAEEALRKRLTYEKLLSAITASAVRVDKLQEFEDYCVTAIGETLDVSRAYIFRHCHQTDSMDNTSEWCAAGTDPQKDGLQGVPSGSAPWWVATLKSGQSICYSDIEDIPDEGAKAILRPQKIRSLLAVPMTVGGRYYGFIGFDECRRQREWPAEDVDLLLSISRIIASVAEYSLAEQTLRESEERLRSFVANTFMGIYRTTPDGRILMANPAIVSMLGYDSFEDLARRNLEQEGYNPGYDRVEFKRLIEQNGQVTGYESQWRRKDGTTIWLRENARGVRDAQGQILHYEGTVEDITEQKQAEAQLTAAAKSWEATFDSIGDGVCLLDRQWRIVQCNKAFSELAGLPYQDILGKSCHEIVCGLSQPDPDCPVLIMERTLQRAYGEIQRDGKWLLITADPIIDAGGSLSGAVYNVTDVTGRRLMEQELQQAQKMEAIGQLAGGVAHDFNNMLAGIMGNAEMLYLRLAGSPEHMVLVERILRAGEHAANLTRQLLSFARKGQYQMEAIDVHRSIGNVAGILASTIDRRIRIKQSLRARPSTVMGDPAQIENALMNLALNARDAMPNGGDLIFSTDVAEIDTSYVEQHKYRMDPGSYIMISVTDTGTGMDSEIRQHLFEPFFTTKGPGKGTGLGLASVYGITKNHKGSIEAYSEPGYGTVMKIYLPLTDQPQVPATPLPAAAAHTGTGSILLVDDEHMIREMAGQMLQGLGYTVVTCKDGQEAVDYYRMHHDSIDLVILDMIMPRMNGREAFLQMRQINPGVRTLLSSGFSADGETQEVLKLGIAGFVQKPIRMAELAARIQETLGKPLSGENNAGPVT